MKDAINYIFNIKEDEKLKDYTSAQRYAVYLIKQMGKLHTFNKNDNVIRDSFLINMNNSKILANTLY